MLKVAVLVWIVLGASLAGAAMIAVLAVPDLAADAMRLVPRAVICGFVVAIPLSFLIARKIARPSVG
ncbi:MAG: hypothetical protein HXX15_04115 [Rhodopseudomonas sp.]|uniref:hypothetical protein n=1 Tax=Rhodopseudomonas sp. TaxID=1078 RepID=UPI00179EC789|nr:hypothetical protein [Rhodopseudomonas sp.]NVN85255.1 hypothetical protein [Rhodopseudomonas sp.]